MQRFSNMTGVFLVMASAVRALDSCDAERELLRKIAKTATAEIVSSKVEQLLSICILAFFEPNAR
jgi:maestro heat-like repeat-containing protein family member 1